MEQYLVELPGAQAFLCERFGESVQGVQELGRGEWSVAFAYRFEERDYIARFGLFEDDFRRDQIVAAHASDQLPIPQILEIGRHKHGYFAISERAYGNFLDQLDENAMRAVLPNLLCT